MIIGWNEFQLNNFSLQKLETEKFFNSILYERSQSDFRFYLMIAVYIQ